MANLQQQFIERLTREIFRKKNDGFVLKGGGAMRALYGAHRLTKDIDLDFTNPKRTAESLHATIQRAIDHAARGLQLADIKISHPGRAEKTPRWKVNLQDRDGAIAHVEIEVSREQRRAPPGTVVQRPYVPQASRTIGRFWVDTYDEQTLIATKLAALLGREVPRDVYDLDLLKDAAEPPNAELVDWAIGRANLHGADPVTVLRAHLDVLTWARFRDELLDALPGEARDRMSEAEWQSMKSRVGAYAQKLLSPIKVPRT